MISQNADQSRAPTRERYANCVSAKVLEWNADIECKQCADIQYFARAIYLLRESLDANNDIMLVPPADVCANKSASAILQEFAITRGLQFIAPRSQKCVIWSAGIYNRDHRKNIAQHDHDTYVGVIMMYICNIIGDRIDIDGSRKIAFVFARDISRIITVESRNITLRAFEYQHDLVADFMKEIRHIAKTSHIYVIGFKSSASISNRGDRWESVHGKLLTQIIDKLQANVRCDMYYAGESMSGTAHIDYTTLRAHFIDIYPWIREDIASNHDIRGQPDSLTFDGFTQWLQIGRKYLDNESREIIDDILRGVKCDRAPSDELLSQFHNIVIAHFARRVEIIGAMANSREFISKIRAQQLVHELPFSYGLFHTNASSITFYLARKAFTSHQHFNFARKPLPICTQEDCNRIAVYLEPGLERFVATNCDHHRVPTMIKSSDNKYRGAYNMTIPIGGYMAERPVMMFDFSAMYPSIMLAFDISPWNFVTTCENADDYANEREFRVIFNDREDGDIHDPMFRKYFVFRRQHDTFLQTIEALLNKRITLKEQLRNPNISVNERARINSRQLALKKSLNTMYGLMASFSSCYWYDIHVAAAVALAGRIAIKIALQSLTRWGRVMFVDTDSGAIEIAREHVEQFQANEIEFSALVAQDVNARIRANLGAICDSRYLTFEHEANFTRMYVAKKKTYLKLTRDCFGWRGLQFSRMSADLREITIDAMRTIFMKPQDEWRAELVAFIARMRAKIRDGNSDSLRMFARHQRLVGDDPIVIALLDNFSTQLEGRDTINIVPLLRARHDNASDRWIPLELVSDFAQIDYEALVVDAIAPNFVKFFGPWIADQFANCTFIMDTLMSPDRLNLRIESIIGDGDCGRVARQFASIPWHKITQYLPSSHKSIHEIIVAREHKLFFDIDGRDNDDIMRILARIERICHVGRSDAIVLSACNEHKKSYHVIYPYIVDREINQLIAQNLHDAFPSVDVGVYSRGHSLRLPCCPKIHDESIEYRPFLIPQYTHGRKITLCDCLISMIVGLGPLLHEMLYSIREMPFTSMIHYTYDTQLSEILRAKLCEVLGSSEWSLVANGHALYISLNQRVTCPFCERIHTSERLKLTQISDSEWALKCFKMGGREMRLQLDRNIGGRKNHANMWREIVHIYERFRADRVARSNRYIDVNFAEIAERVVFVRAQMGAGKSHAVAEYMAQTVRDNAQWLIISNRRTLSSEMLARTYSGIKLIDYREGHGMIRIMRPYQGLVIQTNSLGRIAPEDCRGLYVLLDECESIIGQFANSQRDSAFDRSVGTFEHVLSSARKVIAMDACLSPFTRECIRYLCERNEAHSLPTKFIEHWRPPYSRRVILREVHTSCTDEIDEYIRAIIIAIRAGDRVVSVCTSRRIAEDIARTLRAEQRKVLLLSGNDESIEVSADAESSIAATMHAIKREVFADIDSYISREEPQLLIYTSTLTAGVSVNIEYFTRAIHYYTGKLNPIDFIQAMERVRRLRDDVDYGAPTDSREPVRIFLGYSRENSGSMSLLEFARDSGIFAGYDRQGSGALDVDLSTSFAIICRHLQTVRVANSSEIIIAQLIEQGYEIEVEDRNTRTFIDMSPSNNIIILRGEQIDSREVARAQVSALDLQIHCANNGARDLEIKEAYSHYIREHPEDIIRANLARLRVKWASYLRINTLDAINALTAEQIDLLRNPHTRRIISRCNVLSEPSLERQFAKLAILLDAKNKKKITIEREEAAAADEQDIVRAPEVSRETYVVYDIETMAREMRERYLADKHARLCASEAGLQARIDRAEVVMRHKDQYWNALKIITQHFSRAQGQTIVRKSAEFRALVGAISALKLPTELTDRRRDKALINALLNDAGRRIVMKQSQKTIAGRREKITSYTIEMMPNMAIISQ